MEVTYEPPGVDVAPRLYLPITPAVVVLGVEPGGVVVRIDGVDEGVGV